MDGLYVTRDCSLYDYKLKKEREHYIKNNNVNVLDKKYKLTINFGLCINPYKESIRILNYIILNIIKSDKWILDTYDFILIHTDNGYQISIEIPFLTIMCIKTTNEEDIPTILNFIRGYTTIYSEED